MIMVSITYHVSSIVRQVFPFQNNPQNRDPSDKTGLDILVLF